MSAPPVDVAKRAEAVEAKAPMAANLDRLDFSDLGLPPRRPRRAFGLGAAASIALHGSFVLAALLWSQSQVERAPEPVAVEIVVESAPAPAPVETPAPVLDTAPPIAETPPPDLAPPPQAVETPAPLPEPTPSPVAEAPAPPEPAPTPQRLETPQPTPTPVVETPAPDPVAVAPPPIVEPPPPAPVAKIEPPKPTPLMPKKAEKAPQTPAKPKPTTRPAASHEASMAQAAPARAAAPAASSASAGEYRDAIYARLRTRQRFPEAARESGAHGTAELTFSLDATGQLQSVSLLKSSGDAELDADALATVRRSAPFAPPPPGAPREFPVKLHYALQ